jgi:antitoxin component HigA of HigAB toxin-antitoxin module
MIFTIDNDEDYNDAILRVEELWDTDEAQQDLWDELQSLIAAIGMYENEVYPIETKDN